MAVAGEDHPPDFENPTAVLKKTKASCPAAGFEFANLV
jgi:hypothetical protein